MGNRLQIDYRLPTTLSPLHYKILFHPDLKTGHFSGQETITIKVIEATKEIVLHSNRLTIINVSVLNLEVGRWKLDSDRQLLIISMMKELTVDEEISLTIFFEGYMRKKTIGLYSLTYKTPEGRNRSFVLTKFEPTYARQAYPCFDEPALKATFTISVVYPNESSYHALSNMNKVTSKPLGENTLATFDISVPMSTYLSCFIVSDFDLLSSRVKANGIGNDFTMRAYAAPHQLSKVEFSLKFGVAVTEFYIQYFKVEYPLPKLDMVAIPEFPSYGMENWGLITYRDTFLLFDEKNNSCQDKQTTAALVAHEITHQWFGNLVTMRWWNDLWLNEGFARFLQYKGVNAVHSDWRMLDQFQIKTLHSALRYDAKLSSHPIVQKVESPKEIKDIFDTIRYDKAGSILRMLESLVGEEVFQNAINNYLTKYQYQNTETDDFLSEVAALVTNFDVKLLMRTWTEQMGYPVLNVQRMCERGFTITQKRFLSNKDSYDEAGEPSEFNYKWDVPVTYMLDTFTTKKVGKVIFNYNEDALGVAVTSDVKWIKLNVNQVGFYRVNYDWCIWDQIIQQLIADPSRFDAADRAHLLNDAFALADACQLCYAVPLNMTGYLKQEQDFVPWHVASDKLITLKNTLMYTDSHDSYLSYARSLLTDIYKKVGWTVDANNHLKNHLRVSILTLACAMGLPDCLSEAADRFNTWLKNPTNRPSPELREVIYYYGMQETSSESNWEELLELFKAESDPSEKLKLMYGLSGVQDAQLLHRFLELASDESIVQYEDHVTCLHYIAANPVGEQVIWDYYREQWPHLVNRFGLKDGELGRLITTITARFSSHIKLNEVKEFFAKYPECGVGAKPRQRAIETINCNINWLQKNSVDIAKWFAAVSKP